MEINQRIFFLLNKQGKKANELADYIGISSASVSAWKTENSFPSSKYVVRISEFFGVPIGYLFTGKEPLNGWQQAKSGNGKENTHASPDLTDEEIEMLEEYRRLGYWGRNAVDNKIKEELKNRTYEISKSLDPTNARAEKNRRNVYTESAAELEIDFGECDAIVGAKLTKE